MANQMDLTSIGKTACIEAVFHCASNTAFAVILGGSTIGSAVVTIGLPAVAVAVTIVFLNALSVKLLHYANLTTEIHRRSTHHMGWSILQKAVVFSGLRGVGVFLPIFRINLLFSLTLMSLNFVCIWMQNCSPIIDTNISIAFNAFWMDALGVFVRA